jgi:hypothetical protein
LKVREKWRVVGNLTLDMHVGREREKNAELEDFKCGISGDFGLDDDGVQIGTRPEGGAGVVNGAGKV